MNTDERGNFDTSRLSEGVTNPYVTLLSINGSILRTSVQSVAPFLWGPFRATWADFDTCRRDGYGDFRD